MNECLQVVKPLSKHIENDRRLNHYLERIFFYTNRSNARESCNQVLDSIASLFPQVLFFFCFFSKSKSIGKNLLNYSLKSIDYIKSSATPRNFVCKSDEKPERLSDSMIPNANINFYDGKLDPYKFKLKVRDKKSLKFGLID